MHNLDNIKQLTNNDFIRLVNHEEQQLLFLLVNLILYYNFSSINYSI